MSPATGPAFHPSVPFATLQRVGTPRGARWVSRLLLFGVVLSPVALLVVPWQQTVQGRGQVVAFAPAERKQVVTALVGGQVKKWYVVEGSKVKAGDKLADIDDNDPGLSERLALQRKILSSRKQAAEEEVTEQQRVVQAQVTAREAAMKAAAANRDAAAKMVDVSRQQKMNAAFVVTYEQERMRMVAALVDNPLAGGGSLAPKIDKDEAKMRIDRAKTEVDRAEAEIARAAAVVETNASLIAQADATGQAAVATARGNLRRAEQNVFAVERELQELDTRIARFDARFVKAPCDGVVFRISSDGQSGQYVKEGDELAVIVPDTTDRVVELLIDGVDAPLIAAHMEQTGFGPHVRLQFEGWPAVQFAGWPSVAAGTFGGRVRQMDATDDGNGRFRILVEPEQLFEEDVWPEGIYLRQGNQAIGWVFLNRVSLGYELWRQFNGFPPVVAPNAPDKTKDKKKDGKPPKIKPAG